MKEHQRRQLARWMDAMNGWWRLKAACLTGVPNVPMPDWEDEELQAQRSAAYFCNAFCPVKDDCLAHALNTGEEHYVWGGTTSTEREHLMKKARTERREAI